MAYDPRAVKIKKAYKATAILMFNKERERHFLHEIKLAEEKSVRTRVSRNRGEKDEE